MYTRMTGRQYIWACLIVVIILIIYRANANDAATKRFWVADPEFLAEAGLSDMILYIGEDVNGGLASYLVIADMDKNLIVNQPVLITYHGLARYLIRSHHSTSATIIPEEASPDWPWPEELQLTFDLAAQTLTIRDDEKIYAFMYRDLIANNTAI